MPSNGVSRPRVYVRIRPLNQREREGSKEVICHGDSKNREVLYLKKEDDALELQTRFDHIFDVDSNQHDVFDCISPEVMRTLFSGYNASIFAYGQTGSGKTYTMSGEGGDGSSGWGIIPRLVKSIFARLKGGEGITSALVEMSMVQIYQERIQDLLNDFKQLDIHMDRTGQYVARDVTWRKVKDVSECMRTFTEASKRRATSSTDMNLASSRSHMILMLKMQWDEPTLPGSRAQLNLVDLAGSERLNESGAKGETMMEAIHINKSLSALGNVVIKLVEQARRPKQRMHIPYKDSKLTYLLQSSLGGSNLVHFILNVSASVLWRGETSSTIEFGKRALQVVLRPVRNAIDYTRLAEMEAIIESMRTHIESLEEELQNKRGAEAVGFPEIKAVAKEGLPTSSQSRGEQCRAKKLLKRQTELARIMENLPETFDDLTSHCVLFPESKAAFRELGGLEKLIFFVDSASSPFYRSNAAQAIASVIDDMGRARFAGLGGMEALMRLLLVPEERCKEAACVALEAVCRGYTANKAALSPVVYEELVGLIDGYPNQQVQETACAAVASIVDGYPESTRRFEKLEVVPKLLETIRTTPDEVANLIKAATNCVGRLAHGDAQMQQLIASCDGVDLLIDVLLGPGGDRDHQVSTLASYALVNLCCGSAENLEIAKQHARYGEVKYCLLEGLARAFGANASRQGFGRATAQEATLPFPYYGVTIQSKWAESSSGGRPIYSTFMDNPQFYLFVREATDIAFVLQDTLYEARMRKKRRNNAVYMGLALFEGDAELAKVGMKELDFQGKMVDIGRYTSNCENVLHCSLHAREAPYVVVPFTNQKGRQTTFALSAFGDHPIELSAVPDQVGWVRTVVEGSWTEFTGRAGENLEWRCNPQIRITAMESCRVVFVLSYLSLDQSRARYGQEDVAEEPNSRPRLHGRLFTHAFAPERRYLKAFVPIPKSTTLVASNTHASNSYITTCATLQKGGSYAYIPFTETPFQDTFRVSVYCESDELVVAPLEPVTGEWLCTSFAGTWAGKPVAVQLSTSGKLTMVAHSPGNFLRIRIWSTSGKLLEGMESYWNSEATVEYANTEEMVIRVDGITRALDGAMGGRTQEAVRGGPFNLFLFTEQPCTITHVDFDAQPSALPLPTQSTPASLLGSLSVVDDLEATNAEGHEGSTEELEESFTTQREAELLEDLGRKEEENRFLSATLERQRAEIAQLRESNDSSTPVKSMRTASNATPLATPGEGLPSEIVAATATALSAEPPSAPRLSSATPRHAGTRSPKVKEAATTGGGPAKGKAEKVASSSPTSRPGTELRKSVEDALLKLDAMRNRVTREKATKENWTRLQRDIEDVQHRLLKGLEGTKKQPR